MGTSLEELRVLQVAEGVADPLWSLVGQWGQFERDTVGQQLVRAVDSIGANIAEAFGRYHYGEKLQFLYYARGSLFETKYWVNRAAARALVGEAICEDLSAQLNALARQINSFAAALKSRRSPDRSGGAKRIREDAPLYGQSPDPAPIFSAAELAWLANQTESDSL